MYLNTIVLRNISLRLVVAVIILELSITSNTFARRNLDISTSIKNDGLNNSSYHVFMIDDNVTVQLSIFTGARQIA